MRIIKKDSAGEKIVNPGEEKFYKNWKNWIEHHRIVTDKAEYSVYENEEGDVVVYRKTINSAEELGAAWMFDENFGRMGGVSFSSVVHTGIRLCREEIERLGESMLEEHVFSYGKQ